jgi:hypothetical protein
MSIVMSIRLRAQRRDSWFLPLGSWYRDGSVRCMGDGGRRLIAYKKRKRSQMVARPTVMNRAGSPFRTKYA